ncbi:MAG TPA: Ig-like domain-containing protein [Acidothermaceae bacterium]
MSSRGGLKAAIVGVVGVLALSSLAACERAVAIDSLGAPPSQVATTAPAGSAPAVPASPSVSPPVQLTVAPADGATAVALGSHVSVSAADGTLTTVTVADSSGDTVVGSLDPTSHSWDSTGALVPGTQYLVTATAVSQSGTSTETSSSFTTAAAANVLGVKIAPLEGEVVGVGMPIVVYFTSAVTNEVAVEKALVVDSAVPIVGSWHWYGNKEVHYRPMQYWPAGDVVTLHANLKGVDAGKGVWGTENRTLNFTIGASQISTVNAVTDQMTVVVNGVVARTMAVSTGRDKYPTTSGIHVVLDKAPSVIMNSATVGIPKGNPDYYYETVLWDVRISWSGEYVHSAPWSVSEQGRENVSHGCVNASPADAQWFYNLSRRGDIVTVTGTPRPLESGNGWTDWNMSWSQWISGSALTASSGVAAASSSPTPASSYGSTATPPASASPTASS